MTGKKLYKLTKKSVRTMVVERENFKKNNTVK